MAALSRHWYLLKHLFKLTLDTLPYIIILIICFQTIHLFHCVTACYFSILFHIFNAFYIVFLHMWENTYLLSNKRLNHSTQFFLKFFVWSLFCYTGKLEHNLPFLTDGAVMPSWFDIFEIPVSAVSLLAKYISVLIVIFIEYINFVLCGGTLTKYKHYPSHFQIFSEL